MKDNQRQAMIAEVMENFDFETVHRVMTQLDWQWAIEHGEKAVPSVYRLMKQAEQLLTDVAKYDDRQHHEFATGGLRAIFSEDEDLELRFEIESSTSYSEDYGDDGEYLYKD